jgi:uncharacterized protein YndB with AHSA1/START domain
MLKLLFGKEEVLSFERTYPAPIDTVWDALTSPDAVREWWGPEKTVVTDCEIDVRVGGRIAIVMQATEAMGKYAGTRWPMEGTFTAVERPHQRGRVRREAGCGRDEVRLQAVPRQARDPPLALTATTRRSEHAGLPRRRRLHRRVGPVARRDRGAPSLLLASGLDETIKWGKPCYASGTRTSSSSRSSPITSP